MKRVVLLLAAMGVALAVGSGVALAAVEIGTGGHDVMKGTEDEDVIHGGGSWDVISGMGDDDVLYGDEGSDSSTAAASTSTRYSTADGWFPMA
jgi:Ca2+-binding RTX toxin-like protein